MAGREELVGHEFIEAAKEVGFSKKQAEFMEAHLAMHPHTHDIEDVEGLGDALVALGEEDDEEEETD